MDAQLVFENLLKQVMDSSLNYKLEMSPFSAVIQLKQSFIRDKSGINFDRKWGEGGFWEWGKETNQAKLNRRIHQFYN